jgi:hypothetical protein
MGLPLGFERLLARIARGESRIYEADIRSEEQLPLLREVAAQRTRLERSFTSAMVALKQLQKQQGAAPATTAVQANRAGTGAGSPLSYVMSEGADTR